MNKGQWVIVGFVGLALATSAAYISIQLNASPAAPPAESPSTTAPPAAVVSPDKAATVSQDQARAIAINVLKGDPYGATDQAVRAHIAGESVVEEGERREWVFAIRVAPGPDVPEGIAGDLRVDAKTGEWKSNGLPFLD